MHKIIRNKKGVALVSTLFFLIIVTMLATGAIILSTVQMKVASSMSRWDRGLATADGGINYVIPLLQYAHFDGKIPSQYLTALATAGSSTFLQELQMSPEDPDLEDLRIPAAAAPSLSDVYDLSIDIDTVGTSFTSGGGVEASWAYHGSAYSSSLLKAYRVRSVAIMPSGSSRTSVCQIIWLRAIM